MKKNVTAIISILFFTFVSCKTGDINMPKGTTKSSSAQKVEYSTDNSDTVNTSEQNLPATEIKDDNNNSMASSSSIDSKDDEKIIEQAEEKTEDFKTITLEIPESKTEPVVIPEVEKRVMKSVDTTDADKDTEIITVNDKKTEIPENTQPAETTVIKKETVQTDSKPAVKQEQPTKTVETTKKTSSTVAKTPDSTVKKTEDKTPVDEKQTAQETDNSPNMTDFIVPVEERSRVNEIINAVPSRSVEIALNQYLDVFYPGAGWVYLGEQDESVSLLSFFDRNLADNDTQFILKAKKPGKAILHFYKQDLLTNTYIDDYLEVVVTNEKFKGRDHSVAPAYAEIVPPNQQKYIEMAEATQYDRNFIPPADNDIAQNLPPSTQAENTVITQKEPVVVQRDESDLKEGEKRATSTIIKDDTTQITSTQIPASENVSLKTDYTADELLALAKKAKEEQRYNDSLDLLNKFFEKAVNSLDEGWFLKGQLYEEPDTEFKNIRTSLESYQILVDRYPSSRLWKAANERINYINRFYFKIR